VVAGLHALVPSFAVLFTLRIALGLAEAPSFPGAAQTVHRVLPPDERARGLGILFTGSSFGAMLAPKLAAFFNEHWGWRAAFLGSAVVGLLWVPVWFILAWNTRARAALDAPSARAAHAPPPDGAADVPKPTRAAPAEELDGAADGHKPPRAARASSPDGAADGHKPPRAAPAAEKPFRARDLLANRAVWRGVALILGCAPLLGFHFNWLSKLVDRRFHATQSQIGNLLILPPLLFDAGAVLFGSLGTRQIKARPDSDAPPYGLITVAVVVAMTGVFLPMCPSAWPAMVLAGISMAGGGGLYGLVTADVLRRVPPAAISTAGGLLAAAQSLALIIANPLIGRSVEATGSYTPALQVLAALHLPFAAVWLLLRPPPVHRVPSEADIEVPARERLSEGALDASREATALMDASRGPRK
jgi:ACS family hexuronate transporter-like MFS transporter